MTLRFLILVCTYVLSAPWASAVESICYGRVAQGRLEGGVQLPTSGKNYAAYNDAGVALGRTYVHSKVKEVVLDAYRALEQSAPSKHFIYGETGWKNGGRIRPHRTHQNGLSIDFMVPVKDKSGTSIALPTSALNKFGYGFDFDLQGKTQDLEIDFDALAEHLYQISVAAKKRNVEISLVIFDPPLLPKVFSTKHGAYLEKNLPFMKGKAWIRHDEHYHIDFAVPCKPFKS
jgi:penicillin-insensitive murein endopeptidase